MEWTKEDKKRLKEWRNVVDYDGIKIKERIKEILLNNKDIIHVLNNKELEDAQAEPDEYFNVNILPYYLIAPVQTATKNYICYTVGAHGSNAIDRYNKAVKYLQITFVVLCHNKDILDRETSLARHDLLAALIQDQFNNTNIFGAKVSLVDDAESVVDNDYACRTLIFEQRTDNNLVRTRDGEPRLDNKTVYTQ